MPARTKTSSRRDRRRLKKKEGQPKKSWKMLKIAVFLLLPISLFVLVFGTTKFWDGKHKLAIVLSGGGEDVDVAVFDPTAATLTVINIPGSTEVDVARNFGRWRLKSVVKLGEKEDLEGALLAETLTRHFRFPVFAWGQDGAKGFMEGDLPNLLRATFTPYKTNLGIGDRVRLMYFGLTVKNSKKVQIRLAETRYLKKTTLSDGEEGFELSGNITASLAAVFSEPDFTYESGRTKIIDRTGVGTGKLLAQSAEVLGLKVVSINNEQSQESDCLVAGKEIKSAVLVSRLFGCEMLVDDDLDLDLVITVGKDFAKRF